MKQLRNRLIGSGIALFILGVTVVALMRNGAISGTPRAAFAQFLAPTSTANASTYVTPGTLTFTNGAPTSPSAITLSNADQTETYTIPVTVSDNTGSGAGWNLQITLTQFTAGSHTLASNVTTIDNPTISACQGGGTCTLPTNGIASETYPLTTTADGSTQTKFFSAQLNTGMGSAIITPTFTTTIQAKAYAGTYTSTFTITLNTGP